MKRPPWKTFLPLLAVTGALAAGAAELPGPAIELPPMVIEETATLPPWLYVRMDEIEYLSRCSESVTRDYVTTRRSRMELLRALVPETILRPADLPVVTLLLSQGLRPGSSAEVIDAASKLGGSGQGGGYSRALASAPNMMLEDSDMIGVFAYVDERRFRRQDLTISSEYLRFLLERRTPAPSRWLVEGILGVYNDVLFQERAITLAPLVWHSRPESARLAKSPQAPRTLLSGPEMFLAGGWSGTDLRRRTLMRDQATLFVRWALDPRNGTRDAFWEFAVRACEQTVTDEMFTSSFGFGLADLRDRLSDYLPLAVRSTLQLPPGESKTMRLEIRPATPTEVARLRGEWERLSVPLVRRLYPEHAHRYLEQARRTLHRAYEAGDRDARLLATLGLFELDARDERAAGEYLEAAVAAGVARPRAHYELARWRWVALTRGKAEARFEPPELAPILTPLRETLRLAPPLPEAFELLAAVCARAGTRPPAEDLEQLAEGGRLFQARPNLCLRIAAALGSCGRAEEARAVLGAAFPRVGDDTLRAQFAQLFAALGKTP